jgi:acyl-ACP thioesterase
MPRHSERFPVHVYEVDAFHALAVPALAGYLEEVAGHHATELGCGIEVLLARGLTWVLVRQRIELLQPIALGEELTITTWPSGVDRLLAAREFEVRDRSGAEVARSSTQWLVLDVATRRPVRPDEILDPALRPALPRLAPVPARLPAVPEGAPARRFHPGYGDIDVNLHVNNTSYLAWAIDAVDPDTWRASRPCELEAHFLAEGLHGDALATQVARDGDGALLHAIMREGDGKELARLRTRWVAR